MTQKKTRKSSTSNDMPIMEPIDFCASVCILCDHRETMMHKGKLVIMCPRCPDLFFALMEEMKYDPTKN